MRAGWHRKSREGGETRNRRSFDFAQDDRCLEGEDIREERTFEMRSGSGWQVGRLDAEYIDFLWRSLTILPLRELLRSCCETGCGE